MKKVFLVAAATLIFAGITVAQTTPRPAAKQPAKKEAAAPAKQADMTKEAKAKDSTKAGAHHHKKHGKAPAQS